MYLDEEYGNLYFKDMIVLAVHRRAFSFLQKRLLELAGPTINLIFYRINKKVFLQTFPLMLIESHSREEKIDDLLSICSMMGYGLFRRGVTHKKDDGLTALVEVTNCINILSYKDKLDKPICYGVAGILAGIYELVYGFKTECEEIKCEAAGDDKCLFQVTVGLDKSFLAEKVIGLSHKPAIEYSRLVKKKFVYNQKTGETRYRHNPAYMISPLAYALMMKEFEKLVGEPAKNAFYEVAKASSKEIISGLLKSLIKVLVDLSLQDVVIENLQAEGTERGLGKMKIIELDRKKHYLRGLIWGSSISRFYGEADAPVCSNNAGNIAGAMESLFGVEMDTIETKCTSLGDPYCEFEAYERTRFDALEHILGDVMGIGDTEAVILVASAGQILASVLPPNVDSTKLANMVSLIAGSTHKTAEEINSSQFQNIVIESDECKLLISSIENKAQLMVLADPAANLGLLEIELERICHKISRKL